jgi:hypothetical protein
MGGGGFSKLKVSKKENKQYCSLKQCGKYSGTVPTESHALLPRNAMAG